MNFRELSAADVPALRPWFAAGVPPLSEYSLPSLAAWNGCLSRTQYATDRGALVLLQSSLEDPARRHLLLPLCPEAARSPRLLRERALALGVREYRHVPQSYLELWTREEVEEHFTVVEQPEYSDYVYRREDLAELPGRPYAKKRNLVRQFERAFMEAGTVSVEALSAANAARCLGCLQEWRSEVPAEGWNAVLECESRAITRAFESWDVLGLRGLLVAVEGRVRGFAVASPLTTDSGDLLFEKASDSLKGLYQFLDRECARRLFPDVSFINKECDHGDPGLEKAKRSYHPAYRVQAHMLVMR